MAKPSQRGHFAPSSFLPGISVKTDGRRKTLHNNEVADMLRVLRDNGITQLNADHIIDGGLDARLPLAIGRKIYDIAYVSKRDTLVLVEIKTFTPEDGRSNNTEISEVD
jgi:hypothetical protein